MKSEIVFKKLMCECLKMWKYEKIKLWKIEREKIDNVKVLIKVFGCLGVLVVECLGCLGV